ncbi:hypothetical protein OIU78_017278 [Salix suchowensis]|nr:hypothetical protein OIU78_017278 [Salix suchowensis]
MEITASVLRSFTDIFYMLHIIFQFRTGRGVLVDDTWAIAKRYLSSYFLIDILSVLPLPQVVILIITLNMAGSSYLNTKNVLKFVVIFQYVPRFMRIYPLYNEVATSGNLTETAWAGAAFNLFLYMLGSHVSLVYSTVRTFSCANWFSSNLGTWSQLVFVLNRTTERLLDTSLWDTSDMQA